jgi:Kef-type K+ transport system membrane component KefB
MEITLQILLFLALLIGLAKTLGGLSRRAGLPSVLGELVAGVMLGPTVLNIARLAWFAPHAAASSDPVSLSALIRVLAGVGVVVLMFLAGLETDLAMMRTVARTAFWAACGGVLLPLAGGAFLARAAGFGWPEALFMGTVLTATSVSITAATLMNLGKLRSRAGSTILGAAVIDDVLGLIVLSLVIAGVWGNAHLQGSAWRGAVETLTRMAVFGVLAFGVGPRFVRRVFDSGPRSLRPQSPVAAALVVAFLFAFFAQFLGGMADQRRLAGPSLPSLPAFDPLRHHR